MDLLEHAPRSFEEYVEAGGGRGLEQALTLSPTEVIHEVVRSGLRGRGGGGFPTGEKWASIAGAGSGRRFVVCNGAEGEPAPSRIACCSGGTRTRYWKVSPSLHTRWERKRRSSA